MTAEPSVNPFTVERHPLSAALDSLELDESHALDQSVRLYGVVGRIIIGHVHGSPEISGKVIDGWHTLCAWKEACSHDDHFKQRHPIEPHIVVMWFDSEEEMSGFASSMQLGRRNYDIGKRAFLIIRHFQERALRVPSLKNLMDFCSASGTLIKEVKRVARADPALGDAFLTGVLGLHDAAAVARLPAGEQAEAIKDGTDGLKDKAREVRERRPSSSSRLQGFAASAKPPRAPEPRPEPGPERVIPIASAPESAPAAFPGAPQAAAMEQAIGRINELEAEVKALKRALAQAHDRGGPPADLVSAYNAASPAERRAFALSRWPELAAAKRDAVMKANGVPAFDKDKAWRTAESLQRTMSRNPQVGELCEALKQSLVYMP